MSEKTLTLRLAAATVASYDGLPADSAQGNLSNMAPRPDSISEFRVRAGLAIATDQTDRLNMNLKAGTVGAAVEVAPQAMQIQASGSAVSNAAHAQVINDIPNVTQNPLFYAILQSGAQPRNETSNQHSRRSINDWQSVSAS